MTEQGLFLALKGLSENYVYYKDQMCKVFMLLKENPEEAKQMAEIIDNEKIIASAIARTLTENGYQISSDSVRRHRNRKKGTGCKCP